MPEFNPTTCRFLLIAIVALSHGAVATGQAERKARINPNQIVGVSLLDTLRWELNLQIAEITRVCNLDEQQQSKLRVAAKGAVDRWYNQDRFEAGDQRLTLAVGALASARLIDPVGTDLAIFDQSGQAIRQSVRDQPAWEQTLRRVLSPDQREKLKQQRQKRLQYERMARIRHLVAAIDGELLFSAVQRVQMEKMISEKLSDRNGEVNWAKRLIAIHEIIDLHEITQIIPRDELSQILSEHQLLKWTKIASGEPAHPR